MLPLLGKELMEQSARRRTWIARTIYASILFIIFALLYAFYVERFTRDSGMGVLGMGRRIFEDMMGFLFAGIYVFLPAMVSGVITYEKERQSLPLLILTGMSPWRILLEKLLGRLIPMGTFLLVSLPLMATCYALGGVEPERYLEAVYLLLLTCLQAGFLALACSAWCRTSVEAFIATYVFGTIF